MKMVGILGAGTMGSSIAASLILNDYQVILYDISGEILENARNRLLSIIEKGVARGKVSEDLAAKAGDMIQYSLDLSHVSQAGLIIEAAPESLEIKADILKQVDSLADPDSILITNTSSISINVLASFTGRADRFVGLHFFNPAHIMPLVEIIPSDDCSEETMSRVTNLAEDLGKTAVVSRDLPGFIVNRVARPFYGEAFRLLAENASTLETIDTLMKSAGFPMGPFELIDLVGSDVNLAVTKSIYAAYFQEPKYRPHPIQEKMVKTGRLGRKAGRGFYEYNT